MGIQLESNYHQVVLLVFVTLCSFAECCLFQVISMVMLFVGRWLWLLLSQVSIIIIGVWSLLRPSITVVICCWYLLILSTVLVFDSISILYPTYGHYLLLAYAFGHCCIPLWNDHPTVLPPYRFPQGVRDHPWSWVTISSVIVHWMSHVFTMKWTPGVFWKPLYSCLRSNETSKI